MANTTTVARPYAKAILAVAREQNTLLAWSQELHFLSQIVSDPIGHKIISNLALLPGEKVDFITSVATDLSPEAKNLLKCLARVKRLLILPELYKMYEIMRCELEGLVNVSLTVAETIDNNVAENIVAPYAKNHQERVSVTQKVDESLISGAIAQIGNRVIDGSLMGRLQSLRNLLNS